jgi:tRNA pseudouridine38-40 synthase
MQLYRYFLELSYVGTQYCGWQIQPGQESVQNSIEKALKTLLREQINLIGAGRTDSGVHAMHYTAHFDTTHEPQSLFNDMDLRYKLNRILPNDIAIHSLKQVTNDAHARFSALSRSYSYYICLKKDPFWHRRAWLLERTLNIEKMNEASQILFAYNNFQCFSKSNTQVNNYNCSIMHAGWKQQDHVLVFEIRADRFLRNMVRAIVGTLTDVGMGKTSVGGISAIIESKNRSQAGLSVPGYGLYFMGAQYDENIFV